MLTKEDINYFKEELLNMKTRIESSIKKSNNDITLMSQQDPNDEGDYSVILNDSSIENKIIEKQVKELKEIETALGKIADGKYGICEMCEDDINIERLKVKPFARFCISCREINEKKSR